MWTCQSRLVFQTVNVCQICSFVKQIKLTQHTLNFCTLIFILHWMNCRHGAFKAVSSVMIIWSKAHKNTGMVLVTSVFCLIAAATLITFYQHIACSVLLDVTVHQRIIVLWCTVNLFFSAKAELIISCQMYPLQTLNGAVCFLWPPVKHL